MRVVLDKVKVAAVILLVSLLTACTMDTSPSVLRSGGTTADPSATGDAEVQLVTPCEFTYNDVLYSVSSEFWDSIPNDTLNLYALPSGQQYLVLTIGVANGKKNDFYVSTSDFQVYADNRLCDEKIIVQDGIDSYANIASGRYAAIYGFYAVPKNANNIEIEYSQDMFANKVTIEVG